MPHDSFESLLRAFNQHIGSHHGASSLSVPHTNIVPVVDDYSRLPKATKDVQFQLHGVRSFGQHRDILYCCLGNVGGTAYEWVEVAQGVL